MSMEILTPKIRGFICTNSHSEGCAVNVKKQYAYAESQGAKLDNPLKALIIGASTGYGLSSRIALAGGYGADTLGIFYERQPDGAKTGTAGFYNSAAFNKIAKEKGLWAKSINGDAFSNEIKSQAIEMIKAEMGKIDYVIYSLASPRRIHPTTGVIHSSVLKPVGEPYSSKSIELNSEKVIDVTIQPATEEEVSNTVTVMGGDDWKLWLECLLEAGVLNDGVRTLAYSYIGPEVTWPIYRYGTIGKAKEDLEDVAQYLENKLMQNLGGHAWVSVNKAVVTQASAAIPVVPLYLSILIKVMKEKNIHEGCIEQIVRLFKTQLINNKPQLDESRRIRMDDWEMREEIQKAIADTWIQINTDNLRDLSAYDEYKKEFRNLFGFEVEGVDYSQPVEINVSL